MKYIYTGSRLFLGLIFLVFGLNGFFLFIPVPPMAAPAQEFIQALLGTGYMLWLWKGTEVVAGALLLLGWWVPLALLLLAPIVVNIFFFHLMLDPGSTHFGVILVLLSGLLAWQHRSVYAPLFRRRSAPVRP